MITKVVKPGELTPSKISAVAGAETNVIVAGDTCEGHTFQFADIDLSDLRNISCEDLPEIVMSNTNMKITLKGNAHE